MHALVLPLLPLLASAKITALSQLFQLSDGTAINNVKFSWSLVDGATNYTVVAGTKQVASSPGNTADVYDLEGPETFHIQALDSDGKALDKSQDMTVTPLTFPAAQLDTYDNLNQNPLRVKSSIKVNDMYYRYNYVTDDKGYSHFSEQTSDNGYEFTGDTAVLPREVVCKSVPDGFCKLESIKWAQHPETGEAIMWAHFENAKDYTLGQVAGASGTPGTAEWAFSGAFRPMGDDSRDLTFFADKDGKGYVIAAIKTNTDLGLYELDAMWHNVTGKVATLQPGERREAPAMVHVDDHYYLFTSTANGWYPSEGKYVSASTLAGPWTASRNIGSAVNFGAQSGQIAKVGTENYLQASNRWAGQWKEIKEPNRQILLPVAFQGGLAAYHFYHNLSYSDELGVVVPVQTGRILSVGQPVTASAGAKGSTPKAANDGIQDDPANLYVPETVPFFWQVDLGAEYVLSQVDITPKSTGGSDTYLQYTVEASANGDTFKVIIDESANKAVGFRTNRLNDDIMWRYVRINVSKVVNIHNGNEASWAAGVHEVTVYGNPQLQADNPGYNTS